MAPESKHNRTTKPNHGISHHITPDYSIVPHFYYTTPIQITMPYMPCHAIPHHTILHQTPFYHNIQYLLSTAYLFFYRAIPYGKAYHFIPDLKNYQVAIRFLK